MNCRHCQRAVRPQHVPLGYPYWNTVVTVGRGLCRACWEDHKDDYPLPGSEWPSLFAELDWLDGSPEERAARISKTPAAISKAAYRHGRVDIAREFNSLAKRVRPQKGVAA